MVQRLFNLKLGGVALAEEEAEDEAEDEDEDEVEPAMMGD